MKTMATPKYTYYTDFSTGEYITENIKCMVFPTPKKNHLLGNATKIDFSALKHTT